MFRPSIPSHRIAGPAGHRSARALAASLCLVTALGLSGCGAGSDGDSDSAAAPASSASEEGAGGLSRASDRPTTDPAPQETSGGESGGLGSRDPDDPSVQPTTWSPPELKFYNENWSYWYQDDSITNQESVSSETDNLEGYRTYAGSCLGIAKREINPAIHTSSVGGMDDAALSDVLTDGSNNVDDFSETGRETVSLVRTDGGTLEGYNVTYTGTYTWAEGAGPVSGYLFVRAVGEAGLNFTVMLMCKQGDEMTPAQWHEVLGGIRIEGLSATTMSGS